MGKALPDTPITQSTKVSGKMASSTEKDSSPGVMGRPMTEITGMAKSMELAGLSTLPGKCSRVNGVMVSSKVRALCTMLKEMSVGKAGGQMVILPIRSDIYKL